MATPVEIFVIDACALIAYLRGEAGGDKLRDLLRTDALFFMHGLNLGEVYYDTLRTSGLEKASQLFSDIADLPMEVVWELDRSLIERAGHYKTRYRVSYADAFVLALAEKFRATVISTDHHEFDPVDAARLLAFYWLR